MAATALKPLAAARQTPRKPTTTTHKPHNPQTLQILYLSLSSAAIAEEGLASSVGHLSDAGLATLAAACPGLQVLSLAGREAWGVCHEEDFPHCPGLVALAAGCPELTNLDVAGCGWVDEASLLALAAGCRRLERLRVSTGRGFTDAVAAAFGAHGGLQELAVAGSRTLGDAGLGALLAGCGRLEALALLQCPRITDASVARLPLCGGLQELCVASDTLTLPAFEAVAPRLRLRNATIDLTAGTLRVEEGAWLGSTTHWSQLVNFLDAGAAGLASV